MPPMGPDGNKGEDSGFYSIEKSSHLIFMNEKCHQALDCEWWFTAFVCPLELLEFQVFVRAVEQIYFTKNTCEICVWCDESCMRSVWENGSLWLVCLSAFVPPHGALRHFVKLAMKWSWEILEHHLRASSSSMWAKRSLNKTLIWVSLLTTYWSWDEMLLMLFLVSVECSEVRAKSIGLFYFYFFFKAVAGN